MPNAIEFIQLAWPAYRKNFWQFVGLYGALLLVIAGIATVGAVAVEAVGNPFATTVFLAIALLLGLGFILGSYQAMVNAAGQGRLAPIKSALTRGWQTVFAVATLVVVSLVLYSLGLVLFIIPGILLLVFLNFSLIEVVLGDTTAIAAIKESIRIVRKAPWSVAQLVFLSSCMTALAGLVDWGAIVSLIVIYPLTFLAQFQQYAHIKALKTPDRSHIGTVATTIAFILVWLVLQGYTAFVTNYRVNIETNGLPFELNQPLQEFLGNKIQEI